MALWKARGGSLNKEFEFRSWQDFRLWHSGWQGKGSLNKEDSILDHGIVEGKGGEV